MSPEEFGRAGDAMIADARRKLAEARVRDASVLGRNVAAWISVFVGGIAIALRPMLSTLGWVVACAAPLIFFAMLGSAFVQSFREHTKGNLR